MTVGVVPLWAQGNTVANITMQMLAVDSAGVLTTTGSVYSFVGKLTTWSSEPEEELEDFTPIDIYGKQWVGTGQDETYRVTEQLSRVKLTNFLRKIWVTQAPGLRYVQLIIDADGETDTFVGYMQSCPRDPRARGRNTQIATIKRTNYSVSGVLQANPAYTVDA